MVVSLLVSGIDLVKKNEKAEAARSINWSTGRVFLIKPKQAVMVIMRNISREVDDIIPFINRILYLMRRGLEVLLVHRDYEVCRESFEMPSRLS